MNDGNTYFVSAREQTGQLTDQAIQDLKLKYGEQFTSTMFSHHANFSAAFERAVENARHLFEVDGGHITIGFLLDRNSRPVRIIHATFADHTEKLVFWSRLAYELQANPEVCGMIFVSEFWMRSATGFPDRRIGELEILGEGLHIVGIDKSGSHLARDFRISRDGGGARLTAEDQLVDGVIPNFLVPIARAWGLNALVELAVSKASGLKL
jgi:hypothetical protein